MSAKELEVLLWLKDVVGEKSIGQFERSESNVDCLHKLMTAFKIAENDVESTRGVLKDSAEAHELEGKRLEQNLRDVGVSENLLQPHTQSILNSLTSLYTELHVDSFSATNLLLTINSVEEENDSLNKHLTEETKLMEKLLKFEESLSKKMDHIKNISVEAESSVAQSEEEATKERQKMSLTKQKIAQYQKETKLHQAKLRNAGFEPELSLESISKKIKKIQEMKKEVEEKEKRLRSYALPPDMALAEVEVEKKRQELSDLMKSIAQSYSS